MSVFNKNSNNIMIGFSNNVKSSFSNSVNSNDGIKRENSGITKEFLLENGF